MAVGAVRSTYGMGYAYQGMSQPAAEENSAEFFAGQETEAGNAEENGYAMEVSGYKNFMWTKQNWSEVIGRIKDDYATEGTARTEKSAAEEREERIAFLSFYIEEQLEKWRKGEIKELSFQIGARLFTEKEWDALLEKFDAVMDTIRESMKQELERRKAEEQREKERKEEEAAKEANRQMAMESSVLLAEKTLCTGPALGLKQPEPSYIICYTEEGIVCRRTDCLGGWEWSVSFGDKEQYNKVMDFLKRFPEGENLVFAANKEFWETFLQDEIDTDSFPYVDVAKMQWEQYRR